MEEKVDELANRLDRLTKAFEEAHNRPESQYEYASGFTPPSPTNQLTASFQKGTTGLATVDVSAIESDFLQIKTGVASKRLPKEFLVPDCKSSKRDCQHLSAVVNKCARYSETALKVLWSIDKPTEDTLATINTILCAQIHYLQGEQANVFVQSNFSNDTAKIFRSLQGSKGTVSDVAIENIKTAASLASVKVQHEPPAGRGSNNLQPRSFGRFPYRGRGSGPNYNNVFDSFQGPRNYQPRFFKRNDKKEESTDN